MKIAQIAVELIDSMGDDLRVVNAARVSHDKESQWEGEEEILDHDGDVMGASTLRLSDKDAKLVKYLDRNGHWAPFAHCFASFRIKAPIFVARQLVKHQVGLVWNEVSRRYVDKEPEFWFPKVWRERPESNIKQGSGGAMPEQELWGQSAHEHCENLLAWYRHAIKCGVAPEQARMLLPLTTMTEWYWSGSLAAFARVCNLRLDPNAQEATREVAGHIDKYMRGIFPVSWGELVK